MIKRMALWSLAALAAAGVGCGGAADDDSAVDDDDTDARRVAHGLLQFHVVHNLQDDSCLLAGDCDLTMEEWDDPAGWLQQIGDVSDMAVLHWDMGIPWDVFSATPPAGEDREAFYDERLDPDLLAWLAAYEAHFQGLPSGYVAVSILTGDRDRLAHLWTAPGEQLEVAGACDPITPDATIDVAGNVVAVLPAYQNFVLYLADKLDPEYLALMVEANLYTEACPAQADGLYETYAALVDAVRAELGDDVLLFATLSLPPLLDYDVDACWGGLAFVDCANGDDPPPYPDVAAEDCYPMDLAAIEGFDRGGRLDVLALSAYPDALSMAPPGIEDAESALYPGDYDGTGDCLYRAPYPPLIDPMDQLARLEWTRPMAWAEISSRSCPTTLWFDDGGSQWTYVQWASDESQLFWLDRALTSATEGDFAFVVYSFLRDYDPLGPWLIHEGVLPWETYDLFNIWPCSGLTTADGQPKGAVTRRWTDDLTP